MKKNDYFEIGDIVNTHSGEQGIVIEIIDDFWVVILQCDGHAERTTINDIWEANTDVNGKCELNAFFMKIFGYSSIYS